MDEDYLNQDSEVLFNSGIEASRGIARELAEAAINRKMENFSALRKNLQIIETRMYTNFRQNPKDYEELIVLKNKYANEVYMFDVKMNKGKKVPHNIYGKVAEFLTKYEELLVYFADIYGYRMPRKSDKRFAAYNG